MEIVDDDNFRVVAKTKVGLVPAKFDIENSRSRRKTDRSTSSSWVEGKDILTKSALTLINVVKLRATSIGQTEVSCTADLYLDGRFATFGQRITAAKAKQLEDKFIECIVSRHTAPAE